MKQFLEIYNLLRSNHEEIENLNLNRPITGEETESAINNLPMKDSPGPDVFEFFQTFKK